MKNTLTKRWSLVFGAGFAALALAACERPVERDPDAQPPPGGDPVANVDVTPPEDDPTPPPPVDPNPTPTPPPPTACPLDDGRVVDCTAQLGNGDAYCANVYAAENPDFGVDIKKAFTPK